MAKRKEKAKRVRKSPVGRVKRRSGGRRLMVRRRGGGKKRLSLIKAAGLGIGTYFGLTLGHAQDPMAIVQNPMGAVENLFSAITGVTYSGGSFSFNAGNFGAFWLPVASFWLLDVVAKKLLHKNIKLTKDVALF